MKKLLSILSIAMISSASVPYINFANSNISKINTYYDKNNQANSNQIKTVIKKQLNNDQEEEKKYLIDAFEDINLINKIQSELSSIMHKDNRGYFIYKNDVYNVESLDLSNSDIVNFHGLDFFPSLTSLNIANNSKIINLTDFQLICREIQVFNISGNNINDIDIIMYFVSLKELNVSNMHMKSGFIWDSLFLPLTNIDSLTKLDLSVNQNLYDISLLSKLINLKELSLSLTNVSNISVISVLTNLTYLRLDRIRISNTSFLSSLTNLTNLFLSSDSISNISVLSSLTNLTNLYLDSNSISNISALTNLTNLTTLYLDSNSISNISALTNLTNLTYLLLNSNNISDISPLGNLINLTTLTLNSNRIPNTDEAWSVLHKLPKYNPNWDSAKVRRSQRIA